MTTPSVIGKPDPNTGIYRHGFGLKSEVAPEIADNYHSALVEQLKANGHHLQFGPLGVFLAREFGFCYGVEKAVDFAYQTRTMFPGKRIFLTAEIIHNPRVNKRLLEMGVAFLSGQYADPGQAFDSVQPDDVVILPAFGATIAEIEKLRARGCTIVDTTCGSVIHVWKRVEKYARDGFTAVIHGKHDHEETLATASRVTQFPGAHYLILLNREEADTLCQVIRGELPPSTVFTTFAGRTSPEFDPEVHLQKIGVANQTTMLASESLDIARRIGQAILARSGPDTAPDEFRSFDTICSATQDRQDAIRQLGEAGMDLILVVGGFNSSNTSHLIELAATFAPAYHIESAEHLLDAHRILHKPHNSPQPVEATDWLPQLPLRVGLTAGASTPNRAIGDVVHRLSDLLGVELSPATD